MGNIYFPHLKNNSHFGTNYERDTIISFGSNPISILLPLYCSNSHWNFIHVYYWSNIWGISWFIDIWIITQRSTDTGTRQMSKYVLAWYSYNEISTELDGNVVGVYESLAQAQSNMQEQIEDSLSYAESDYIITTTDSKTTLKTNNGYLIEYIIKCIEE